MKKKRFILLAAAAAALASCQKNPDLEALDGEYLVYTQRDTTAEWTAHASYFVPDSILVIGNSETPLYWKDGDARKLAETVAARLDERGFTRAATKEEADLGMQLSYVSSTRFFVSYPVTPYWWWYYPGYWDPYYWGAWGTWGYGFPVYYSYSENSLLMEMLDLAAPTGEDEELPVVWNAYIDGDLSGYRVFDLERMARGIDQAFEQSPYIQK